MPSPFTLRTIITCLGWRRKDGSIMIVSISSIMKQRLNTSPTTDSHRLNYGATWQHIVVNINHWSRRDVCRQRICCCFLFGFFVAIDPPLLVLLCFCVLRFCRRPPRPIIIASSILYQQRLGISQIPATFHEIPVKCSSWIWWRSWTEGLKNSRFSLKWQNLFKPKFNIFLAATQSRSVCMTIRKESRKIK